MSKYNALAKINDNARALTESNIYIANELAEANRLKRMELRDIGIDQEELKDRA